MTSHPVARPDERPRSIEHPLRNKGFPELCVIRDRVSSRTDRRDAQREADGDLIQVEYRVYAPGFERALDGVRDVETARVSWCRMRLRSLGWLVSLLAALFSVVGSEKLFHWKDAILLKAQPRYLLWALLTFIFVSRLSKRIIYESITALPSLGIQFTTQRAYTLPGYHHALIVYPSSTTTIFIPLPSFRPRGGTGADAVFVHEGLQRWGIRYYLGLLWDAQWRAGGHDVEKRETADSWQVQVGFPNLQPRLPILREVYYGVRETMFNDYAPEA